MTLIARSAAERLVTGLVNVTITGWATPTTAPLAGRIDATVPDGVGGAIAAIPGAAEPTMVSAAINAASQPVRIALPTVSTLRDDARPPLALHISNMPYVPLSKANISCARRNWYPIVQAICPVERPILGINAGVRALKLNASWQALGPASAVPAAPVPHRDGDHRADK